jgi:hypothetical protein
MKEHFCSVEQSVITYQGECNWCGQKEWIGLDEVEIIGCTCECIDEGKFNMDCAIDFARAIEAKLKQRNT